MEIKTFGTKTPFANLNLWAVFFLYIITAGYTIAHHELWGDEIHSWNIAKASGSFSELLANTNYEGHPPVWYIILWFLSKLTHNPEYIQLVQIILANSVVFLVLFYSPFPFITRTLIPFGYYFLFEYGVLSRNYAIGILAAFCVCLVLRRNFKYKFLLYYALLLFMSNTHLLAMLLAGSLHLYFLLLNFEQNKKISSLSIHILLGILIFLPSLYFIFPPSESWLNIGFLMNLSDIHQLGIVSRAPLRAFFPVPAWWNYNFWNTQIFLELQDKFILIKYISILLSLAFLVLSYFILRNNKKSLILFVTNLFLTFIISFIFPLTAARYVGFIFIGFIAAYWLYCYEAPTNRINKWLINTLLAVQLIAGIFAASKEIHLPFSNSGRINELLINVPENEKIVTDVGCVNNVSAFTDKSFYCIGLDREVSFILWNTDFKITDPYSYSNSIRKLCERQGLKKVYLISIYSPPTINQMDSQLEKHFQLTLIDKIEGAIEKWSNLYLYQISILR